MLDLMVHAENVARISYEIGLKVELNATELENLFIAAKLHDCGKTMIPYNILNKPGKLTSEEYEIIKKHSMYSAKMLNNIGASNEILKAVLCHHEQFNGCGYPTGIKGEEIPVYSRIIAIADAFDAMTYKRCYGEVKSYKEAIKEIKVCSGKQFDPDMAKLFIEIYRYI